MSGIEHDQFNHKYKWIQIRLYCVIFFHPWSSTHQIFYDWNQCNWIENQFCVWCVVVLVLFFSLHQCTGKINNCIDIETKRLIVAPCHLNTVRLRKLMSLALETSVWNQYFMAGYFFFYFLLFNVENEKSLICQSFLSLHSWTKRTETGCVYWTRHPTEYRLQKQSNVILHWFITLFNVMWYIHFKYGFSQLPCTPSWISIIINGISFFFLLLLKRVLYITRAYVDCEFVIWTEKLQSTFEWENAI